LSIYKACDIRGDATRELSPDLYYRWGRFLGSSLEPGSTFITGGDVRPSTPAFLKAFIDGLQEAGLAVIDLGIVPTPIVYFAKRARNASACAIVTASHSPSNLNGLKWMLGDLPPTENDIRQLREKTERFDRTQSNPQAGSIEKADISVEYLGWLKVAFRDLAPSGRMYVVLDPGNGCWAGVARRFLREVFPETDFTAVHDEPDGTFPHRHPDSARRENLQHLVETVRSQHADLGVAFDGDGDRVAFVDSEGALLSAEETTWVLLRSFGDTLQSKPFVHDLKFSDLIPQTAKDLGANPMVERSGHAFIRTRMLKAEAAFGAEISGHYFYQDLAGGDDGLYTACRMISYLTRSGKPLADHRRACPRVFITPDLRLSPPDGDHERIIAEVKATFPDHPQSFVDGVRVDFPEGWGLLRSSVTEDTLTFRFEGQSQMDLAKIVLEFCEKLPEIGRELRKQFEQSKGTDGES
jgi:phosphomannomutase/phosphoglucomutase